MKKQNLNQKKINDQLIRAINKGDQDIIEDPLFDNVDPNIIDDEGIPIVIKAYENFKMEIVEALLKYGAVLDVTLLRNRIGNINRENSSGVSVLSLAVRGDLHLVLSFVMSNSEEIIVQSEEVTKLLHEACTYGSGGVVGYLVGIGVKLNCLNSEGRAPIHTAIDNWKTGLVEYMLRLGADINFPDIDNNTVLHYAAISNNSFSVKYLVKWFAPVDSINNAGESALDIAKRCNYAEIVECLKIKSRPQKMKKILENIKQKQ